MLPKIIYHPMVVMTSLYQLSSEVFVIALIDEVDLALIRYPYTRLRPFPESRQQVRGDDPPDEICGPLGARGHGGMNRISPTEMTTGRTRPRN